MCNHHTILTLPVQSTACGSKDFLDFAQFIMQLEGLLHNCNVYMDDICIWTNGTFGKQLAVEDSILQHFADNNMKCNPLKCNWVVQKSDFLGY